MERRPSDADWSGVRDFRRYGAPIGKERTTMKTQRRKRQEQAAPEIAVTLDPTTTIFSSDLLTPEEERELLATFWEMKTELVKLMIRHFPKLRAHRPAMEPWPMAQYIRDYCDVEQRTRPELRRVY